MHLQKVSDFEAQGLRRDQSIENIEDYDACMQQRDRVLPAIEIILTKQAESVATMPGFMIANPAVKPILIGENALARKRNPHALQKLSRRRNLNNDYNMPELSYFEEPGLDT